jgi:alcohol oxidase
MLSDSEGLDAKMVVWMYKKQREIMRRMDVFRGEYAPSHPAFAADSDAACRETDGPLPPDVPDIVYTDEDDAIIEDWAHKNVAANWHSLGTCKMAVPEEGGVVDENLGVYGIERLKVADLSVVPLNVASNTANLAMTIGEKAADIFTHELAQKGATSW